MARTEPEVPRGGTSAEEREYYTRIMDEAREARQHEQELAKIAADKEVALIEAKRKPARSYDQEAFRRGVFGVLVGLFVLSTIATIIGFSVYNVHQSDSRRDAKRQEEVTKQEQARTLIAQSCITSGNIWINNSCILAKKS